jgi:cysteine desulfurase / selenocysteine lyase
MNGVEVYQVWMDELQETKELFAKLIGSKKDEIAGIPNTSTGLSHVANLLPYEKGSNVVINDLEFPANTYPWFNLKKRGVEVRCIKNVEGRILLEDVERMVDDKTVALSVSHVEFSNGLRNDLRSISEIVHRHGAYLVVDVIQSAGALKIDVKKDGADFLATSFHKWLLGPEGTGFLYIKDELIGKFDPVTTGWLAVEDPEAFDNMNLNFSKTAQKFESGTHNLIGYVGAKAAIEIFHKLGMDEVEKRVLELSGKLQEELERIGVEVFSRREEQYRSGITTFKIPEVDRVLEELKKRRIVVSKRMGGIRVSPHIYNTEDDITRLVEAIKKPWN